MYEEISLILCLFVNMEIIKSNKGGIKLCYEGYMYTRKSKTKARIQWECSQKRAHLCKGSISTDLNVRKFKLVIIKQSNHSKLLNNQMSNCFSKRKDKYSYVYTQINIYQKPLFLCNK